MKNLARLIIACFAAQLLFVGIANAKVTNSTSKEKVAVCVMPEGPGDEGPWEGF